MSVIVKDEEGKILLFCKGADRFVTNGLYALMILGLVLTFTFCHVDLVYMSM